MDPREILGRKLSRSFPHKTFAAPPRRRLVSQQINLCPVFSVSLASSEIITIIIAVYLFALASSLAGRVVAGVKESDRLQVNLRNAIITTLVI